MTTPLRPSPGIRWHHRVLGTLWGVIGLFFVVSLLQHDSWVDYSQRINFVWATAFVVTSIGFIFGRTWARRTMGVLMLAAVMFLLDVMVPASIAGNHKVVWLIKIGLVAVAYTWVFLAIPQAYQPEDLR